MLPSLQKLGKPKQQHDDTSDTSTQSECSAQKKQMKHVAVVKYRHS